MFDQFHCAADRKIRCKVMSVSFDKISTSIVYIITVIDGYVSFLCSQAEVSPRQVNEKLRWKGNQYLDVFLFINILDLVVIGPPQSIIQFS